MEGKRAGEEREERGNPPQLDFRPKFWRLFFGGRRHPFSLCPRLFSCSLPFCLLFVKEKKGDKRGDFYLPPHFPPVSPVPSSPNGGISRCPPGCYEKGRQWGRIFIPLRLHFRSPHSPFLQADMQMEHFTPEKRGKRRAKSFWRKTT